LAVELELNYNINRYLNIQVYCRECQYDVGTEVRNAAVLTAHLNKVFIKDRDMY
jgi:hypothetical protein